MLKDEFEVMQHGKQPAMRPKNTSGVAIGEQSDKITLRKVKKVPTRKAKRNSN